MQSTYDSPAKHAHGGFATRAIHAGHTPDPVTGAIIPPLSLSTTFLQRAPGEHSGFEYARTDNPTRRQFETAVAALEKAEYGLAFASGSSATAAIVTYLPPNSHILSVNDVYGGTHRYFKQVAEPLGYEIDFLALDDPNEVVKHIRPNTRMIWVESPTNPTLRLIDLSTIAKLAHGVRPDILLTVDNTFLSPYLQNPLSLGADLVVHSATKYLNGHSDALLGVVCTSHKAVYTRLKFLQNAVGWVPAPFDCFLAHRGLKTLAVRMEQHTRNARAVATALKVHPHVERVSYPGFDTAPFAATQMRGGGGMVAVWFRNVVSVPRFLTALRLFKLGESLGGVESLVEVPASMTHAAVPAEMRTMLGISDQLVRLSVGIEDETDLVADVCNALDAAAA